MSSLLCQEADPQVITGSLDSHCRLWDLAAGKTMGVLTHHKKGIRALASHPSEFTFATGSTGSIKQWKCPEGAFMQNFEDHNAIINTLSVNNDNVMFSGGDNGSMSFWVKQLPRPPPFPSFPLIAKELTMLGATGLEDGLSLPSHGHHRTARLPRRRKRCLLLHF